MVNYKKLGKFFIWRCKQKKVGSKLPTKTMSEIEEEEDPAPSILLPCTTCTRTFRPEALAKHSKVCEKNLSKKRKPFDSAKQRLNGTEVETYTIVPVNKNQKKKESLNLSKSKWKEKVELSRVISMARKQSETGLSSQVKPSEHEECPHCGRSFGPKAFERHTDFCKEQHLKLKLSSNTVNPKAMERLKVRTTYRAPLTSKVLNRDRYQPMKNRDPSPIMARSSVERIDELSKPKGLARNNLTRSSFREKHSTESAPQLRRSLSQVDATRKSIRTSKGKQTDSLSKSLTNSKPKVYSEESTHKPRICSRESTEKSDVDKYNPYLSAERQMLELFGGQDDIKAKAKSTLPELPRTSPIQSSPTSAFVKYSSPKRSSSIESLKFENKENNFHINSSDNLDLPENIHLNSAENIVFPPAEDKIDNRKNFSLSSLSLCSVVSIESTDYNKNPVGSKAARGRLEDFQRSFSAVDSKGCGRVKSKLNMQQMLYGSQSPEVGEVGEIRAAPSESSNSSADDPTNLEACEAELLVTMLEFEKMLKSSPIPSPETPPTLCSSIFQNKDREVEEDIQNKNQRNINQTIDSAYSSLTRSNGVEPSENENSEKPKFCYNCGNRYPVAAANFCCHCGTRRLTI